MITKITGILNRVLDEEVRVQVGGLEYQVLVPEFIRRQIQTRVGSEITLHTTEYLEGNPMQGKVVPRMIGFLEDVELDFFELFCTVDKVGVRKALKALTRPIQDIALAIQREDSKWLTTLPGVGAATGEQIITSLKRKVTRYSFAKGKESSVQDGQQNRPAETGQIVDGRLVEEAYEAMLHLGHSPMDARELIDKVLRAGTTVHSVEELLREIYTRKS